MDYAAALTGQSQQLAELLRDADWSVPVPTCPGWTLLQLLRHVGRGDRWAAQIITDRADTSLDAGDSHHAALRKLANRWLEILWHCLDKGVCYDEAVHAANRNRHRPAAAA